MAEQLGYVYRAAGVSAERLRALIGTPRLGWGWTPGDMYDISRGHDLLRGDEGRAAADAMEIRWRRRGATYDVLVLALAPQDLAGFAPVGDAHGWAVRPTRWLRSSLSEEGDAATSFHAPDGSVQFVALIGAGGTR